MKHLTRSLSLVLATLALSACGMFGGDEDELKPVQLVDIETKVKVQRAWSTNIGGSAEFLRVALQPAGTATWSRWTRRPARRSGATS